MKKILALISALFLTGIVNFSEAQEVWSLQKCVDYALENNIQIKQQELTNQYNSNQLGQAKSNRLPNLNAQISDNLNFGRSLTYDNTYKNVNSSQINGYLGTEVTVYNGLQLQNTVKQRALDLQASIQDLQKAKDDMVLNIAASYLEILFAEELTLVSQNQIEVTKQQINRTNQLVDAGSLAKGALLEIQAQLAREELQLVNDQNRAQIAYLNLYQFLDLPISEKFKVAKPTLPNINANSNVANSLDVFKKAAQSRPEILAAQSRVESSKYQLLIAKGAKYPTLSIGANYYNLYNNQYTNFEGNKISFSDQLKNNERYGMNVTLGIPIFNKNQVKNSIANAQLQVTDYELRLQTASNLLRKDIEQAYTNALAALKRYFSTEVAVSSMEEAFRYTEEKFNVGMVNSVEYNQSKNNLTSAQSDLLQAKYEYIFRSKILDFYNGIKIEL